MPTLFPYTTLFRSPTSPRSTVASCYFPERSRELEFRLAINLDLDEKDPFHFILENSAIDLPFTYDSSLLPILAAYRERRTSGDLEVPGWESPSRKNRKPTVATLVALNKAIHRSIGYERREEGSARQPLEIGRAHV